MLKLGHGWVITSHFCTLIWLLSHALIPMLVSFVWDVITCLCCDCNGGLVKPPLQSQHRQVITTAFEIRAWMNNYTSLFVVIIITWIGFCCTMFVQLISASKGAFNDCYHKVKLRYLPIMCSQFLTWHVHDVFGSEKLYFSDVPLRISCRTLLISIDSRDLESIHLSRELHHTWRAPPINSPML